MWSVRCASYGLNIDIQDMEPFASQVPNKMHKSMDRNRIDKVLVKQPTVAPDLRQETQDDISKMEKEIKQKFLP